MENNLRNMFYYALPNNGSQVGINSTTRRMEEAQRCEKIAEEFAIGFAEWCKQEFDVENTPFHNKWVSVNGNYFSTKELLQIFKKEKGL